MSDMKESERVDGGLTAMSPQPPYQVTKEQSA